MSAQPVSVVPTVWLAWQSGDEESELSGVFTTLGEAMAAFPEVEDWTHGDGFVEDCRDEVVRLFEATINTRWPSDE